LTAGLPIKVLRRANRQIAEAAAWWRANRSKAPDAFDEELAKAFRLLALQPNVGVRIEGTRFKRARRFHLSRVHYYLYFQVSDQAVEILELWHASRGNDPHL
jgi:plasmid stabilization system protein ParE